MMETLGRYQRANKLYELYIFSKKKNFKLNMKFHLEIIKTNKIIIKCKFKIKTVYILNLVQK